MTFEPHLKQLGTPFGPQPEDEKEVIPRALAACSHSAADRMGVAPFPAQDVSAPASK